MYKMEGATAGFAFASGMAAYFNDGCFNSGDHGSSVVFLGRHTPCSLIIFQSGIFKHRILLTSRNDRGFITPNEDSFLLNRHESCS
jgi:hypothetical protein